MKSIGTVIAVIALLCWAAGTCAFAEQAVAPSPLVIQLELEGPIGPATADYVVRSIDLAGERQAALVVLRMDTPGGLDLSMREIIKKIIAAPVPVAAYVAPGGARAASAGTYILYASHVAAMALATNLGAATPVAIGLPGGLEDDKGRPEDKTGEHAMERKAVNDAVAYIRGLASLRGRNADWAEKAVREAASLPAEEALGQHVIDLLAPDVEVLLQQLDGRQVNVLGQPLKLTLAGFRLERLEPDWRSRLLAVIATPNIAYILMLVGIYGLILELYHPGAVAPGTIGGICLLLALYAFEALPVNYTGLALILLGMGLMVGEVFAPSFGLLGIGGATAFAFGSLILMDTQMLGFELSPWLIFGFTLASAAFFVLLTGFLLKMRKRAVVTGSEALLGQAGTALEDFQQEGRIRLHGEIWFAKTERPLSKGQPVRVRGRDGLTLLVEPRDKT